MKEKSLLGISVPNDHAVAFLHRRLSSTIQIHTKKNTNTNTGERSDSLNFCCYKSSVYHLAHRLSSTEGASVHHHLSEEDAPGASHIHKYNANVKNTGKLCWIDTTIEKLPHKKT